MLPHMFEQVTDPASQRASASWVPDPLSPKGKGERGEAELEQGSGAGRAWSSAGRGRKVEMHGKLAFLLPGVGNY